MSLRVIARVPDRAALLNYASSTLAQGASFPGSTVTATPDGSRLLVFGKDAVDVYDPNTATKVVTIPAAGVGLHDVSPGGRYLTTAGRYSKAEGDAQKNLQVWDLTTGQPVLLLSHKQLTKEGWPCLQFSHDDSAAFHRVTNTLHMYSQADGFSVYKKLPVKGVAGMAVCPAAKPLLAAFVPEVKGQPGVALMLDYGAGPEPTILVRRSFFRCTGANITWNSLGTAALFFVWSDTDATNQSYYGESKLHYLPADPRRADAACAVPLPKEGPVHDAQWAPSGEHFCVVAGFMPARVTVFDAACKPVYELAAGPYNLVRWSPFSRFLLIAGFGNLPGDMVFYDRKASGVFKEMGKTRCEAVSCSWSPDGRYLLTATTAPRLRVDNNVSIFTYFGEKLAKQGFEMLLDAQWLPVPAGTFEDRPQSPQRLAAGTSFSEAEKPAYTPPHLRGAAGAAAAPAAKFSLARDPDHKPGKVGLQRTKLQPPGAEFVDTKAAAKNAKKRAAKKKAGGGSGAGDDVEGDESAVAQPSSSSPAPAADAARAQLQQASLGGDGSDAAMKRIRALQKKLRQIEQLKERQAKEGDAALEPEQREKIKSEAALIEEIRMLQSSL